MKNMKLLIGLTLILTCQGVQAQDASLVKEGKRWNYRAENFFGEGYDFQFYIGGDTLIGGEAYKKLYTIDEPRYNSSEPVYCGALREERTVEAIAVDFVRAGNENVELLYNFSPLLGDKFYYGEKYGTVTELDEITVRGIKRNRVKLVVTDEDSPWPNAEDATGYWVEGIGSSAGLLSPVDFMTTGYAYILQTCVEDGKVVFTGKDFNPLPERENAFMKEGKRWIFNRTNDWNVDYDYSYTVEGDTLIGGKAYKKVYEVNEFTYKDDQPHYRAALREDGPNVFMVDFAHPAEDEFLLYDFEQGETYVYDEIVHQFVAQDEISVKGRDYRRMTIRELSEEDRQGSDMFLVEGIGLQYCDLLEPCGWTYPGSFVTSMLSCWEDDECIFTLSDFDGSAPTGIENEELRTNGRRLWGKPMKNDESRGGVYDLQGRLVSRGYGGTGLAPSHPRTPAPSIKKGVYIVGGKKYVVK